MATILNQLNLVKIDEDTFRSAKPVPDRIWNDFTNALKALDIDPSATTRPREVPPGETPHHAWYHAQAAFSGIGRHVVVDASVIEQLKNHGLATTTEMVVGVGAPAVQQTR